MELQRAQIVRSLRGRDAGTLLCVMDTGDGFVWVADGKKRTVAHPKRKNGSHVEWAGECRCETIEKVRAGQPVQDRELRRALAAFRDDLEV